MANKPYEVGYGRPPAANQFQKGKSGNPAGRPKGSRGVSAEIADALSERVVVNIDGRRRSISKLKAAFIQQANRAAAGDRHATKLMLDLLHMTESRDEARNPSSSASAEERRLHDKAVLAQIVEAIRTVVVEVDDDANL